MLKAVKVSVSFGNQNVLSDISVAIPERGITCIIGPNGAGKSTLLHALGRLLQPNSGYVEVDHKAINSWPPNELARKLAIMTQSNFIQTRLMVEDLIQFGRYPHHQGRPTSFDVSQVVQTLEILELEGLRKRYLDQLSGGQRQRAFIGMALAQDTQIVLLDEPLNNLDIGHSKQLMSQLKRASQEKSIVMVMHDLYYAVNLSDHVIALKDGELAFSGPPGEVINDAQLTDLFNTQIRCVEIYGQRVCLYPLDELEDQNSLAKTQGGATVHHDVFEGDMPCAV